MIYRIYYDPTARQAEWNTQRRFGRFLLAYALLNEKQLVYSDLAVSYNQWGKPCLRDYPDIYYSVSHCDGMATCVLSNVPAGIDAEYVRPYSQYAATHICAQSEIDDINNADDPNRRFFLYWTLKESCVKAMGTGITYPLKQIIFNINKNDFEYLGPPGYRFLLFEDSNRYVTAVCYSKAGRSFRIFEDRFEGLDCVKDCGQGIICEPAGKLQWTGNNV